MTDDWREGTSRVPRPASAARDWYDALSRWYRYVEPFEAAAREAGLDLLDASAGETVLDAAAGAGGALVSLAGDVGPAGLACGVDVAAGMCRVERGRLADAGLTDRSAVVRGDVRSLPFRDGVADAVFCSFALELFDAPDVPRVLSEFSRVLGDDGRLVVVSLSSEPGHAGGRRREAAAVAVYERLHEAFPTALDCRPIPVAAVLRDGGFRVERHLALSEWGLPVHAVLARPDPA
ncbi:MAG: methyltransferase domain-containing protein [Haloferacaceae archaeon]